MLDQSGKNYNEYPLTEKLERPPLKLGFSNNIVFKSLKVSDNDNGGEVNPEDTPQGNYFYDNIISRPCHPPEPLHSIEESKVFQCCPYNSGS